LGLGQLRCIDIEQTHGCAVGNRLTGDRETDAAGTARDKKPLRPN
jgi:hypothetical protein